PDLTNAKIYEDTPFEFSASQGNAVQISDAESEAFGRPVQVTLAVANGTLGFIGTEAGVAIGGNNTGTVTLTGRADLVQNLLDTGFRYTGDAQYNDVDTLTVTLDEHEAAIGGDIGSGSVANPNVVRSVSIDLIPVN